MKYIGIDKYIPENTLQFIEKWMAICPCKLIIKKNRKTKLGDFKYMGNQAISISVNFSENKNLVFFVLTHEIAHLHVFNQYKNKVLPHGKEWKSIYRNLLLETISYYSEDLQAIILEYANNPKASFHAYPKLVRYFTNTKIKDNELCYVEELNANDFFEYSNEKFQIINKVKTRYSCIKLSNKRNYLFSALAKVKIINN